MQKKVLIAVDNSQQSKQAVRYAARIAERVTDLSFVLFTVQPIVSQFLSDDAKKSLGARKELERVKASNEKKCLELLQSYRTDMISMGIAEDRLETISRPRRLGVAKDIIEHAQKERLDAVVLGRRGMTALQELFMGSVSSSIVQNSSVVPVWLIGGDVKTDKILVPVDGSESALRAIDHLAFIIGDVPSLKPTLFHVRPRLRDYCEVNFDRKEHEVLETTLTESDQQCIEQFYALAYRKMAESGINDERIRIKTVRGLINPGAEIVKEINSESYDTVIMGRSGINRNFFTGSVTNYVINKASMTAIWIVP